MAVESGEDDAQEDRTDTDGELLPVTDHSRLDAERSAAESSSNQVITRRARDMPVEPAGESGHGCLLVLLYPSGSDMGRRYSLENGELVIGRGDECDIHVPRDSVSRRHARVFRSGDDWFVKDLGSTNGSYVNDVRVTQLALRDGDIVKLGGAIFKFLVGAGIEASYHEEIYKLTIMDPLTGVYNKRHFLELLPRKLARRGRHGGSLSLVMIDIDHLKQVNDTYGHLAGDVVLRELSQRLRWVVSSDQVFARYGGDEFAFALPEIDLTGARAFGERACRLVAESPFSYEGKPIPLTVSVGVACVGGDELDALSLVKIADDNLYRAKREGRNRVVAGDRSWERWKADPTFARSANKSPGEAAVAALALLARDQLLANTGGAAYVDDLEGMLYSHLRELQEAGQLLSFGVLEGGSKLLIGLEGRHPVPSLRALLFEALRRCVGKRPEARFAVGPIRLVKGDAGAIEEVIAGLDEELRVLENGYYLPQPLAVAQRALDAVPPARAKLVLELGEALLQWISLCTAAVLCDGRDAAKAISLFAPVLAASAATRRWREVLELGVQALLEAQAVHEGAWRACFDDATTREDLFAWLTSFEEQRDAFARGATARDEHVPREFADTVAPRLLQLLRRELRPLLALVPAEIELVGFEGELQSYRMTRLIGDGLPASVTLYSRRRMNAGLWLCDPIADRAVPMEPFFLRDTCPRCGARELFLLDALHELQFRNPASGHVLKRPIDALPFSPEARERLKELAAASRARDPSARELARRPTLPLRAPQGDPAPPARSARDARPAAPAKKHTILFLAADPSGTERLDPHREARAIQEALDRSGFRDCFELVTRWAAEPLDLLSGMLTLRPTVVHFSGRGGIAAGSNRSAGEPHGLYFQGHDGRAQFVSTAALADAIGAAGHSVKLVVLNACYSAVQAAALLAHVDCVVGMSGAISGDAARSFAVGFYGGLGERASVAAAYQQGRAAIHLEGFRDADRPQLGARAGVDPAALVLASHPR